MRKRLLSLLIAVCLVFSLVPAASAEGETTEQQLSYKWRADGEYLHSPIMCEPGNLLGMHFYAMDGEEPIEEVTSGLRFEPDDPADADAVKLTWEWHNAEEQYHWLIWVYGVCSGKLVYENNGTRYTLPLQSILPDRGFATAEELTEDTYLYYMEGCATGYLLNVPFYYVFPEGTEIVSAEPTAYTGETVEAEILTEKKNVCKLTVTSTGSNDYGMSLEVTFTLTGEDSPWKENIYLPNNTPTFGACYYYEYNGTYEGNLIKTVIGSCGDRLLVGFFYGWEKHLTQLEVQEVTFVPDEATAADAVSVSKYGNSWQISFNRFGSGKLVCTTTDGTYEMPVSVELPRMGFFSAQNYSEETFLASIDFSSEDKAKNVFWLMKRDGFSEDDLNSLNWIARNEDSYNFPMNDYIKTEWVARGDDTYDVKVTVLKVKGVSMTLEVYGRGHGKIEITDSQKAASLIKLATPEELTWNHERPGTMGFKAVSPFQDRARWKIYKEGNDSEPVMSITHRWNSQSMGEYKYSDHFAQGYWYDDGRATADHNMESGTYYFTVQALGDGETYLNSEIAESEKWTYVKPDAALAVPTNLRWDGRLAKWDNPNSADSSYAYCVEFYIKKEENGEIEYWNAGGIESRFGAEPEMELENWALEKHGSGEYYFRVRVLSEDITKVCNSPWSELSPVKNITDDTAAANAALDAALNKYQTGELTEEEKTALKNEVAAANQDEDKTLETAMAADQGQAGGTIDKMKELEELVGGAAKVRVDSASAPKELQEESAISIVGANLNTREGETATLNIGGATAETPISEEQYHNTIQFSMKLDGVAANEDGHQELDVPVQITLPVPASINPSFLVLLHHRLDGTWEEIMMPRTFTKDGQLYVSFVITSFSDFAMAEQRELGLREVNQATGRASVVIDQNTTQVVVAVYSAQGQMLGSAVHTPTADEAVSGLVWLDLPVKESVSTVRAFLLDKDGKPQCERNTLPPL